MAERTCIQKDVLISYKTKEKSMTQFAQNHKGSKNASLQFLSAFFLKLCSNNHCLYSPCKLNNTH